MSGAATYIYNLLPAKWRKGVAVAAGAVVIVAGQFTFPDSWKPYVTAAVAIATAISVVAVPNEPPVQPAVPPVAPSVEPPK